MVITEIMNLRCTSMQYSHWPHHFRGGSPWVARCPHFREKYACVRQFTVQHYTEGPNFCHMSWSHDCGPDPSLSHELATWLWARPQSVTWAGHMTSHDCGTPLTWPPVTLKVSPKQPFFTFISHQVNHIARWVGSSGYSTRLTTRAVD